MDTEKVKDVVIKSTFREGLGVEMPDSEWITLKGGCRVIYLIKENEMVKLAEAEINSNIMEI